MPSRSRLIVYAIQLVLAVEIVTALATGAWMPVFVAATTLGLSLLPETFARWMGIVLPNSFLTAIVLFIFATLFLGEVADFYERFWWWDVVLHFGSAMSFGLVGFLLIFMIFEGDRYAAPPGAIALLSFCVAVSVGALWEIFEFAMDQTFGLNMQKSGLPDTMGDLIVDVIGAGIGAFSGYLYLKGRQFGGLGLAIEQFVRLNRRLFRKLRRR